MPSRSHYVEEIKRNDIIRIASELIAIPSPSGEEQQIMAFVAAWCDRNGIPYQITALDPDRPNVIISIGNPDSGPVIAMNGHLDTVPVSDPDRWTSGPFEPVVTEDGKKLMGRGSSDMKSSVGVMLYLAKLFKGAKLQGCLQVHVVSDEELSGNYGTVHVLNQVEQGNLPKPDYCLIGEGSQLKVRNAERGILALEIAFKGRASHTAAARVTGINAIAKAAKAVLALEGDIDRFHPAVGYPVISINTIHAGVAHNVVPGECTISVDRRLVPGETKESVVREICETLDALAAEDQDFVYEMTIDPTGDHIPANITDEGSPLVQAVQQSIREVLDTEPEFFVQWAGATDGRFYRQAGIDTVGFGPSGENAHGANEAVMIDDLVAEAKVYAATIERLLNAK